MQLHSGAKNKEQKQGAKKEQKNEEQPCFGSFVQFSEAGQQPICSQIKINEN